MSKFIFLMTALLSVNAWALGNQCSRIFMQAPRMSHFGILRPYYGLTVKTAKASQAVTSDKSGVMNSTSFYRESNEGLFRTDVYDFQFTKENHSDNKQYREAVEENIQIVLGEYSRRRDWKPEYLEAIKSEAYAFSERATYFVARRLPHLDARGDILGTMKVIRGGDQDLLPFEIDHNLRVPMNNGRKFEPGNFVVKMEGKEWAFSEVMLQFINFAKRLTLQPGHEPGKMIFFTDADRASSMMYKQLGFTPVPGFEKPLVKNSKEYYLIGASAETVLQFVDVFKNKRPEWSGEHALGFSKLAEILERHDLGLAEINGRSFTNLRVFDRKNTRPSDEPLTIHVSLPRKTTEGPGFRLSIDRQGLSGVQVNYIIPESAMPLSDGWSYNPRSGLVMNYRNGMLEVRDQIGVNQDIFRIKASADLQSINAFDYQKLKGTEIYRRIESQN